MPKLNIYLLFLPILCWGAFSCQSSGNPVKKIAAIEESTSCSQHPEHRYQVFIPSHNKATADFPLLVVIDPHGDGKLAVDQFKRAATSYPAVVVASNLVQNNDPNFMNELEDLIADVKKKYQVGNVVYLAGFSGGARMVINYSTLHSANGVIACGAFADKSQISSLKCKVMSIIGLNDFNFIESAQYILNPENSPDNVLVEITKTTHAWPEKDRLSSALGYFQLSQSKSLKAAQRSYAFQQAVRIDSLVHEGELLPAKMIARNMALVEDFNRFVSFNTQADVLRNKKEYQVQQNALLKSLQFEIKVRQAYLEAFDEKNTEWWQSEIVSLNSKMATEPDEIYCAVYQRIKSFLGMLCYSNCKQFVAQNNIRKLEKTLLIYQMVEPDNADMKHFAEYLEEIKKLQ